MTIPFIVGNNLYERFRKLIKFSLVALIPLHLHSQHVAVNAREKIMITGAQVERIDSVIRTIYKPDEPGAAVLLTQNSKVLLRKGYGMSNVELQVRLDPNHVFAIASMTKYFTAIAILILAEQGKLQVTDDVRKFLPAYNTHGKIITIENLMSHTSGILNDRESPGYLAKLKLENSRYAGNQYAEEQPLLFEPGTNFSYSNPSFKLLAFVIEKASEQSYTDFIRQNILEKIGMAHTYFGSGEIVPFKTSSYAFNNTKKIYERQEDGPYVQYAGGSGSLFSTVDDLYRWHAGLKEGKIISPSRLREAWKSYVLKDGSDAHYGYGRAVNHINGHLHVGHSGGLNGYQSYEWQLPDDDIYFVILSNQGRDFPRATFIANNVGAIVMGVDKLPVYNIPDSSQLIALRGVYESIAEGTRLQKNLSVTKAYWKVWPAEGKLYIKRTGGLKSDLLPLNDSTWYSRANPFNRWVFRKGSSGKVTGIKNYGSFIQTGPIRFGKKISDDVSFELRSSPVDSINLMKYVGVYQHDSGIRIKFVFQRNTLILTDEEGTEKKELSFGGKYTLFDPITEIIYQFSPSKNGAMTQVKFFDTRGDMVMRRIRDNY